MQKISRFIPAAAIVAFGIEACAPHKVPAKQAPVIVNIPVADSESESSANEDQLSSRSKIEKHQPESLSLETILETTQLRAANEVDADITLRARTSQIVGKCYQKPLIQKCKQIEWKERERAVRENDLHLEECDSFPSTSEQWAECIDDKVDTDEQAEKVRAFCGERVVQCIRSELAKIGEK